MCAASPNAAAGCSPAAIGVAPAAATAARPRRSASTASSAVRRRRRAQLELGREQLVAGEALGQLEPRQHLGGDRRERAVAVEQEQLVLDADPERLALAERVLHQPASAASAAIRPITSAPASPLA